MAESEVRNRQHITPAPPIRSENQPLESSAASMRNPARSTRQSSRFCTRCTYFSLCLFIAGSFVIWVYPSPVDPISFRYSNESAPEMIGPLAINELLRHGERLFENDMLGPEAFALDDQGKIYTGLADGRIVRIDRDLKSYTNIVRTGKYSHECGKGSASAEMLCGRPLGMKFDNLNHRELYVVDSSLGLLKVNVETKSIETLISKSTSSEAINLLNEVVELPNGSLLITESSLKFPRHEVKMEGLEGRANGQLLRYDPLDGSLHVVLKGLFFPNGMCLSHDRNSVLIAETTRARILRYHLFGSKEGVVEIFSENLPSWPDNISPSLSGGYWVGSAIVRSAVTDLMSTYFVSVRSLLAKFHLIHMLEAMLPHHGLVLELDGEGHVKRSFHDVGGEVTTTTSHILELDDVLVIGSYHAPYLVKLKLED